jgi:DNA-binding transcriptional MerR regulator
MSAGLAIVALVMLAVMMVRGAVNTMCREEIETRIGRIPDALIRLAAARLPRQARDDLTGEWRAELDFILRDTDGLPVTRLLRGMRYAIGLLRVSPGTASELSGSGKPIEIGYRGPTACCAAGITYRQLDYWALTGLVEPSVGSGSQRLYSFRDIVVLKMVKRLLDLGVSLQQIRAAVQHLRDRGTGDLVKVTLMSDGLSVYELTSPDEVVDPLAGGQGVFGIALRRVWQEVAGELAVLPAVRKEDESDHRGDV